MILLQVSSDATIIPSGYTALHFFRSVILHSKAWYLKDEIPMLPRNGFALTLVMLG